MTTSNIKTVKASAACFIRLGEKGCYAKAALKNNWLYLIFHDAGHEACCNKKWDSVR